MWILVVLNAVLGSDEVKVTYYDTYQTNQKCTIEAAVLEASFTQGEKAVCVRSIGS